MADDVARLVAVLEANIKGFTKGMDQAQRVADRRFGQIEKRLNQTERRFSGAFKGVGRFLIGGAALAGVTRFISTVSDAVGKIQDTSDAIGVSTDALQTWGIVAGRAGVRQEELNKALGSFAQRLGEAQIKGGPFAKFLDGIGVGTKGNVEQVLLRVADAVKKTADQQQKAAIVGEVLGARYVRLVPLFEQGAAGLAKLNAEFSRNGQIIGRETLAKIDELGDKWEDLKKQFVVIGANVLGGIAEEFGTFSAELTDPKFQAALRDFGKILADAAIAVAKIGAGIGSVAGALGLTGGDEIEELRKLIELQKQILSSRGGNVGSVFTDNLAGLEKRYAELLRQKAERSGLGPGFSIPTGAPSGGIDRTGTLATSDDSAAKKKAAIEKQIAQDAFDTKQHFLEQEGQAVADAVKIEEEIRQHYLDFQQTLWEREADELADFHARADAAWDSYYERQADMAEEAYQKRLDQVDTFFGSLATLTRSSSEELRAIGKAAAIIQATIDGVLAVQKALASAPPPFNFALAAAVGAAAAVNVAEIAGMEKGGRVQAGTPYIVGEKRPELFVPDTAGTIIPRLPNIANATQGSKSLTMMFTNHNSFAGAVDANSIRAYADQVGVASADAAVKHIQRRFPSMMVKAQRDRL